MLSFPLCLFYDRTYTKRVNQLESEDNLNREKKIFILIIIYCIFRLLMFLYFSLNNRYKE